MLQGELLWIMGKAQVTNTILVMPIKLKCADKCVT